MRAVNLMPQESRSGAGRGGHSHGGAYFVLGLMAVLVALVAVWALAGRGIERDRALAAQLSQEAAAARAQAATVASSAQADQTRRDRLAAVRTLVAGRMDWAATLDAIARTLPQGTWLTALKASSVPGAAPGGAGPGGALASSTSGPSVQISGCTPSQRAVAGLIPRLRAIPGVRGLTLGNASAAGAGSGSAASGASTDCAGVSFQMVLTLAAPAAAAPAPAGPAPAPPAGATATTPAGGTR